MAKATPPSNPEHRPPILRFLIGLGLIFLGAHVFVELAGIRYQRAFSAPFYERLAGYAALEGPVDVVCIGSSRTVHAVEPEVLESELSRESERPVTAYNLGQFRATIESSRAIVRDVVLAKSPPRLVVLEVSPLAMNSNSGFHEFYVRNFASPWELPSELLACRDGETLRATGFLATRGLTTILEWPLSALPRIRAKVLSAADAHGAPPPCDTAPDWEKACEDYRLKQQKWYVRDFSMEGRATTAFEDILDRCHAAGARVLVVEMPLAEEVRRDGLSEELWQAYSARMAETCERHGVRYLNLDVPEINLVREHFYDGDHLSHTGARAFSLLLAKGITREGMLADAGTTKQSGPPLARR